MRIQKQPRSRSLLMAGLLLMLSGCASVPAHPLSAESSRALVGKTLASSRHDSPNFTAKTAGKALLGVVGRVAMRSAGNQIVSDNAIADPAIAIIKGVKKHLVAQRQMKLAPDKAGFATTDDVATLVAMYGGAHYLLDVQTTRWMFKYRRLDWSHYEAKYSAHVRLIDTAKQTVIAETECNSSHGDPNHPPTADDLLQNQAALLKRYMAEAANSCVEVVSKYILRL